MSEENMRSELNNLMWVVANRLCIVVILGVFGIMNMHYISQNASAFGASGLATLEMVFDFTGLFLFAYLILPILQFGIDHRETGLGKYALGISIGGFVVAIVLTIV